MSKSKSAKRKRNAQLEDPRKNPKTQVATGATLVTPPPDDPKSIHTVISEEELEITVDTLKTLAQFPGLIKTKACKDLRVASYDFRQACTTGSIAAGMFRLSALLVPVDDVGSTN